MGTKWACNIVDAWQEFSFTGIPQVSKKEAKKFAFASLLYAYSAWIAWED